MGMQFIPFNTRIGLGWKRNVPWCVLSGVREMQVSFIHAATFSRNCKDFSTALYLGSDFHKKIFAVSVFSVRSLLAVCQLCFSGLKMKKSPPFSASY